MLEHIDQIQLTYHLFIAVLNATEITGGVGTLKRKRQLRELVENHEKGQTDDFFDATPFKKRSRCDKVCFVMLYLIYFCML